MSNMTFIAYLLGGSVGVSGRRTARRRIDSRDTNFFASDRKRLRAELDDRRSDRRADRWRAFAANASPRPSGTCQFVPQSA